MPPIPQFVTSTVTKMRFRSAVVSEVVLLSGHFRLIQLEGDELKEVAWIPGQKIQVHLGNLVCRTYTPIEWNPIEGRMHFVAFLHGNGSGSEWASSLGPGATCQFTGPRSSLNFTANKGHATFFGDETSIGAAFAHRRSSKDAERNLYFFEVSSLPESQEVVDRLELRGTKLITKVAGAQHLLEVEHLMIESSMIAPHLHWVFTGNAQSIQEVRKSLRNHRLVSSNASTKAYWAYGKKGLD